MHHLLQEFGDFDSFFSAHEAIDARLADGAPLPRGYVARTPRLRDPSARPEPLIEFSSGYVQRAIDQLPRQGSKKPWKLCQNYVRDLVSLRFGSVDDGALEFTHAEAQPLKTPEASWDTPLGGGHGLEPRVVVRTSSSPPGTGRPDYIEP